MVATMQGARRHLGNLPADTTSFLGRRREISEVKRLLSASRLVTLTGPGGVGKTRLALRTAADVRRVFHDRVWYVELAELRDAALLASTVSEQLGLHDQSGRSPLDTIVEHLAGAPVLLVLDNCEQVIEASATFVGALVRALPELNVLTTSRQSLGLLGETAFPVPPFPIPEPDQVRSPASIAHFESVQLFVERASAVVPGFRIDADNCAALAQVCRDLDGLPLALELTAVRLRALSLDQITQRLSERYRLLSGGTRGVPTRQRTLSALMDWSYDLCSAQERLVWARASVFPGSFDLDAVEHIATDEQLAQEDVLDIVHALVDKSILMREENDGTVKFRMLQTTQEYGEQLLVASGEDHAVRRRHRDWFAQLAERFDSEWIGPDQLNWINLLRRCHPDLRLALAFCANEPGEAAIGIRMVSQLDDYWGIRGFDTEGRHWVERLRHDAPRTAPGYISALRMSGWFALLQGDYAPGLALLAEAAELVAQTHDAVEGAYLTHAQGMAAAFTGELDQAQPLLEESLIGFRAARVRRGELFTLFVLGLTLGVKGERDRGLALLDECIAETVRLGDEYWRSYALWAIANIEVRCDNLDRAEEAGKDALRLQRPMMNRLAIAFTVDTLAWIAERREQHGRAGVLFGAANALWRAIGASPAFYRPLADEHAAHLAQTRQALGEQAYEAAFKRGGALSTNLAVDYALEESASLELPEPETAPTPLTRREQEIAGLVTEGMTNRDIAVRLVISPRTVEAHVEHILVKLGFTSRTQIASWMAGQRTAETADADRTARTDNDE